MRCRGSAWKSSNTWSRKSDRGESPRFWRARMKIIEGDFTRSEGRFGIVAARFNGFIVESLVEGALDTLRRHGVQDSRMQLVRVPGAFELPLVVKRMAAQGDFDAIIALGAVIRGGT